MSPLATSAAASTAAADRTSALVELEAVELVAPGVVPTRILWPIDLSVDGATSLSIVGPSGAGKTSLAAVLGGLLWPTAGTYRFDGRPIESLNRAEMTRFRAAEVGFVFQLANVIDDRTVMQNVLLGEPERADRNDLEQRAAAVIERVGLGRIAGRRCALLSGGERQRVAIARALLKRPRLVIADEPTGALDTRNGESILNLLFSLPESGAGLVLVTHDRDAAARADRQISIVDGRLHE